jgi:hypothetical protein
VASGARATEALLIKELEAARARAGQADSPAALRRPLRIAVPSQSLRDHISALLVREQGAWLGLRVQTLSGVAHEVLERAGEPTRPGAALFGVLVRRAARDEPLLRSELDALVDGYALAAASVADLLDAGLDESQVDKLVALPRAGPRHERGQALLRVAGRVRKALEASGLERSGDVLARAATLITARGSELLPARGIWVHGFAEATGHASALIAALAEHCGARVLIDHPPDPVQPDRPDAGAIFSERLLARLAPISVREAAGETNPVPQLHFVAAPGARAEIRAVAVRSAALLDAGIAAERIAVVSRDLASVVIPIREQFGRLGVPYSGGDANGPVTAVGRRLAAVAELLRRGRRAPLDRWLDAAAPAPGLGHDLSLALHALGAGRLADAADLDLDRRLPDREFLPLPVRRGLAPEDLDAELPARAPHRVLPRHELASACERARALCIRLDALARATRTTQHLDGLAALLFEELGIREGVAGFAETQELLQFLARELPAELKLDFAEFSLVVERELLARGTDRLGGAGGGVQILDVTEARARTFDHLFVVGMNRDVFPRPIAEDPLMPDSARAPLRPHLPEIPLKRAGHDEERYLFAQLLSASAQVTLCWQTCDEQSNPRAPSGFVERLLLENPDSVVEIAPGLLSPELPGPRPAHEHALIAGLAGERSAAAAALEISLRTESPPAAVHPRLLARAREAVRREHDPAPKHANVLGPYFGFIGPVQDAADPRRRPLFVTTVERYTMCPWQTFLQRLLQLEAVPDALDALPAIDPGMLGAVVHAALEAVGRSVLEDDAKLAELIGRDPTPVAWPAPDTLEQIARTAARDVLLDRGVELPGLAGALAARSLEYLERARELVFDGPGGTAPLLGVEVEGEASVDDETDKTRTLRFKADAVEKREFGLQLSDYKTGKPISEAARPETRATHLRAKIAAGEALQAVAYRVGAGPGARGRYLFLRPDLADEHAEVAVDPESAELEESFRGVVSLALAGLDRGTFFPRLTEAGTTREHGRCRFCEVAEGCLRGDSSARLRLQRFVARGQPAAEDPAEEALLRLWQLGAREPRG